jgi:glucose-1-phosphate adenylyltransferase
MASYKNVLAIVLGGGVGSRLYPLTKERSKPAVPVGGKYRLVDIPISNCLNSGIDRIFVLTQYNSVSLHRHITQTYKFDMFSQGAVQILAAEQTPLSSDWYRGTADAVRKHLIEIRSAAPDDVLILSGDHLYRMDYDAFLRKHRENRADITIAVLPVTEEDAPRFGIMESNSENRIVNFHEKPKDPAVLEKLRNYDYPEKPFLGSMGVYIFRTEVLFKVLEDNSSVDFGSNIIPKSINQYRVIAYPFDDYWEDIGTIKSFYDSNLALATKDSRFSFYDFERPIYTHPRILPPSQLNGDCTVLQSLITEGTKITESRIINSVVGIRTIVNSGVTIRDSIIMGADYYESDVQRKRNEARGRVPVGIGTGTIIERAIVDKNARIGSNVHIRAMPNRPDTETSYYVSRDGIVVIPKDVEIPDGTVI